MMIVGMRQSAQKDIRVMITTIEKRLLREKILDACIAQKQSLIDDFKVRMKSLLESDGLGNEEEYDDNELSQKGQASEEVNSLNNALSTANEEMNVLRQLKTGEKISHVKAGPGAVVITNKGTFFISVSIEKFSIDGKTIIALSTKSPLYLAMKGLPKKSKFHYNGKGYTIIDIF
jgi:hypothetical protein